MRLGAVTAVSQVHQLAAGHARLCHGIQSACYRYGVVLQPWHNVFRMTCATKRTRTHLGDRSFSVTGPNLWNSLPVALRDRDISLVQFKRLLKTLWFV